MVWVSCFTLPILVVVLFFKAFYEKFMEWMNGNEKVEVEMVN